MRKGLEMLRDARDILVCGYCRGDDVCRTCKLSKEIAAYLDRLENPQSHAEALAAVAKRAL